MKFEFSNPTRLIFGAGSLSRLGEVVSRKGTRALVNCWRDMPGIPCRSRATATAGCRDGR